MKRMTKRDEDGRARLTKFGMQMYCSTQATADCLAKLEDRLAAYEDTGLTPGQVSVLQTHPDHAYADYVRTLWHDIGGMERMEAVAKAEREGRLVVLPCRVGDMLYVIIDGKIYEGEVYHISYSDYYGKVTATAWTKSGVGGNLEDFGKTVFQTREEAEAAMEALHNT